MVACGGSRAMPRNLFVIGALAVFSLCRPASASVLDFNFTGNFVQDNDVQLFTVTLDTPAVLTAWTTSGATGGFPTYLAMFGGDGTAFTQESGDPACLDGFSSYFNGSCNDAEVSEPPSGAID